MTGIEMLFREFQGTGRPMIGCFPLYPPVELLHSMGFAPVILWGLKHHLHSTREGDKHVQNFACSISRHLTEFLLPNESTRLDNVFFYNACDTLRNLPEILANNMNKNKHKVNFFHFHVPMHNLSGEHAQRYFKDEVSRLVTSLEDATHAQFSSKNFRSSVEIYRCMRSLCVKLQERVSSAQLSFTRYAQAVHDGYFLPVERVIDRFDVMLREQPNPRGEGLFKVMISGILPPPPAISDAIEQAGMVIAANDIASLQRSIQYTPCAKDDPGDYYVDFYSNHSPCPTLLFTTDCRVESLITEMNRAGVEGVIFIGEKYCEYEFLELPRIESMIKQKGTPVLSLEVSIEDQDNIAPFKNRIDAFAELLGSRRK